MWHKSATVDLRKIVLCIVGKWNSGLCYDRQAVIFGFRSWADDEILVCTHTPLSLGSGVSVFGFRHFLLNFSSVQHHNNGCFKANQ